VAAELTYSRLLVILYVDAEVHCWRLPIGQLQFGTEDFLHLLDPLMAAGEDQDIIYIKKDPGLVGQREQRGLEGW
jgi:hypothetical protein